MAIIKKSDWPSLMSGSWLSDFFDNDRFFDSDWVKKQSVPAVNIQESDKGFNIEVAAPGLSKNDFKITMENRILTISSEKEEEKEKSDKDYTRREFSYTSFSRSFSLPENVNEENVNAVYEDGVLKIQLVKKALPKEKAKKAIEVH